MSKILAFALAGVVVVVAVAPSVPAAEPVVARVTISAAKVAAADTATPLSDKSTYFDIVKIMSASGGSDLDFSAAGPQPAVRIVKISRLKGYKTGHASLHSLMSADEGLGALDANVAANAQLREKLRAAGYSPDRVLAASIDALGGVTLVVNDSQ